MKNTVIDHMEAADNTLDIVLALMSLVHEYTDTPPLPDHAPEWMRVTQKQMQTVNISCLAIYDLIKSAASSVNEAIKAGF